MHTCTVGKYQALEGQKICPLCPHGRYQDEDEMTQCKSCPSGKFTPLIGSSSDSHCESCPIGYQASVDQCVKCNVQNNKYRPDTSNDWCVSCPSGKKTTDGVTCEPCPLGYVTVENDDNTFECEECPTGKTTFVQDTTVCRNICKQGYRLNFIDGSCELCPSNMVTNNKNAYECAACPAGTFFQEQISQPGTQYVWEYRGTSDGCVADFFNELVILQNQGVSAEARESCKNALQASGYSLMNFYLDYFEDPGGTMFSPGDCVGTKQCTLADYVTGSDLSEVYILTLKLDGYENAAGYCTDWKYLPEGGYPARLTRIDSLYNEDSILECAKRCQAAYPTTTGFHIKKGANDWQHTCGCTDPANDPACATVTSHSDYTSYQMILPDPIIDRECSMGNTQKLNPGDQGSFGNTHECPAGFSIDNTNNVCVACQAGFYNDEWNSMQCKECPEGYWQSNTNAPSCNRCSPGKTVSHTTSTSSTNANHVSRMKHLIHQKAVAVSHVQREHFKHNQKQFNV